MTHGEGGPIILLYLGQGRGEGGRPAVFLVLFTLGFPLMQTTDSSFQLRITLPLYCSLFPQSWFSSGNWKVDFFIPSMFQELFRVVLPNIRRKWIVINCRFQIQIFFINVDNVCLRLRRCTGVVEWWIFADIIWPRIQDVRCRYQEMSRNYSNSILTNG